MCGRYSLLCIDDLGNRFRVYNPMLGARSRFNIAPGQELPVIINRKERELVMMRWGLIPAQTAVGAGPDRPVINVRAETIAKKPSFRHLAREQRCIVPATGFFEWKVESTRKTPFYFTVRQNTCVGFAGIYEMGNAPDGTPVATYTIITTAANKCVSAVHDRMPAILGREYEERWLSREVFSVVDLAKILAPYPAEEMIVTPVSSLMNDPAVDNPWVIEPVRTLGNLDRQEEG